jgi:hypothetical protein
MHRLSRPGSFSNSDPSGIHVIRPRFGDPLLKFLMAPDLEQRLEQKPAMKKLVFI